MRRIQPERSDVTFRLENKVAVIFGGSGYLGNEFCKTMLDYDAIVHSCDIKENDSVAELAKKNPGQFFFHKMDATDKNQIIAIKDKIIASHDKIDILINSTTMKGDDFYLPFDRVSLEGWEKGILGNLTIPFLTCQIFIPAMVSRKKGSIINISSIYGMVGNDQDLYKGSNLHELYVENSPDIQQIFSHGVYNAAKGGLNAFTRYLAAYYGKYNIRVNTLTPGGIYHPGENETFLKKYGTKTPLGRKARPDEMNGALIFLASDSSSYVTGHNLVVDGGFTIW